MYSTLKMVDQNQAMYRPLFDIDFALNYGNPKFVQIYLNETEGYVYTKHVINKECII